MNWYARITSGGQGLIVDETTGETIAVTYKQENAPLIAAAPELLEALTNLVGCIDNAGLTWLRELEDAMKKAHYILSEVTL